MLDIFMASLTTDVNLRASRIASAAVLEAPPGAPAVSASVGAAAAEVMVTLLGEVLAAAGATGGLGGVGADGWDGGVEGGPGCVSDVKLCGGSFLLGDSDLIA